MGKEVLEKRECNMLLSDYTIRTVENILMLNSDNPKVLLAAFPQASQETSSYSVFSIYK